MPDPREDVTLLLQSISAGNTERWKELFSVVYQEIHMLAHAAMKRERPDHTLQTTALVHEAYMRLVKDEDERWKSRVHFFSAAASAMRRILIEEARKRKAAKRGGNQGRIPLYKVNGINKRITALEDRFADLDALDQALNRFESHSEYKRMCSIVELRFFVGLTLEQASEVLDVSMATIKRDWAFTKAWLLKEMRGEQGRA